MHKLTVSTVEKETMEAFILRNKSWANKKTVSNEARKKKNKKS